jgi:DNA-dependent RNA polymerase auxiliary subunit epsilon
MALPPLYKYLDIDGAKKTLSNRTLRHAKPYNFEDLEEMTVGSIFPDDIETALAKLSGNCVDVIVENADVGPTCSPKLTAIVRELQVIFREDPRRAEAVRDQIKKSKVFNVEHLRAISDAFVKVTNEFMQTYRILCVSTNKASERMWEDYAEDHGGIVLRIEPNVAKDSKFQLFRPVAYHNSRPALYDQTLGFLKDALFAEQSARIRAMMDKVIYAKTLRYKFESEYRLAIPSGEEGDCELLPYHPEEITELYLGLAMAKADKDDIVAKAKAVNPKIAIFQGDRDANSKLVFKTV